MKSKKKLLISLLFVLFVGFSFINVFANGGGSGSCESAGGIKTACDLPYGLVQMINDVYNLLKIAVPVVLIIMGMIDLLKAVASQKEEEIKKGWQKFVKRTLIGMLVFFVLFIVQLVIDLLPNSVKKESITNCVKCFFTSDPANCNVGCITTGANTGKNGE